jgi:hypothetical protein
MGSKMQPQIMRQQKSEQILILKFGFIHIHRKYNCGYATHFFKVNEAFQKIRGFL